MQPHFIRRLSAVASLVLFAQAAFGQTAPTLIPFQGRMTNQQGVAYENGQYTLTFNLYSQAVGGSTVWTERHEKVGVVNGMVNVFLGSINSFPQWLPGSNPPVSPFAGTKYLGITIDADANPATADPEMVPRTMLVPAFYAQNSGQLAGFDWSSILQGGTNNPQTGTIRADKLSPASITSTQIAPSAVSSDRLADGAVTTDKLADNSISASDLAAVVRDALIPPGTILPYGGTTAPAGFLLCDGTAYLRAGTYSSLFGVISTSFGSPDGSRFNVPDLRGQFLRGVMPNLTANGTGSVASNNVTLVVTAPATTHPFTRTGMRVKVSGGSMVGFSVNSDFYFVIYVSPTQVAFAATKEDALSGTKLAISGNPNGFVVTQAEDFDNNSRTAMALGGASGSLLGSVQLDALQGHKHTSEGNWFITDAAGSISPGGAIGQRTTANVGSPVSDNVNGVPRTASETRPRNAYVNYIIKY